MPYLTPDTIPATKLCRRILIPNDLYLVAAVSGALTELTKPYNWQTFGAVSAEAAAAAMFTAVDDFLHSDPCDEGTPDEGECTEYTPDAPFIQYAPNDPFQTPDLVPPGYIIPPFYNNPLIPLPGVLPGDAMVNFASLPITQNLPELLETGLPRIRVNFEGTGQVELELVRVPQGGQVMITHDDNPLTARIVDLNALDISGLETIFDIFNIVFQGSVNSVEVVEVLFDTPGDHVIDITFLPTVNEDVILGFGGGLRRVSLCGVDMTGEEVVPQFQVIDNGCTLQWRPNPSAAWQTLSTELCGEDGEDGTDTTLDADHYRVTDCQLEVNEPGGWTPITDADWYRRNALCPSTEFWAQSANPRVWGELADGTDVYNLGIVSSNVELRAFNRNLLLRNGATGSERIQMWNAEGVTTMGRQVALPSGTLGKVIITSHTGTMSVLRLDANSAQSVPILALTSNNTTSGKVIEYLRGTQLWHQWLADGTTEQVNDAVIYDYSNSTTNRREVGRIRAKRENPEVAQWHGTMQLITRNFVNQYINMSLGTTEDGLAATAGVLGALPVPRQVVTGDWQGNEAGKNLAQALAAFGWITDNTTLGTAINPVVGMTTDQDCSLVLQRATGSPIDVDLSVLNCLVPPEVEGEDRRCRIASGAMSFFVSQMYAQSVIIYLEWYPVDPTFELERRLVFQIGTQDAFSAWFTEMSSQYGSDEEDVMAHFNRVNDEVDALAQLYYCYLDDDGVLSETNFTAFANLIPGALSLSAADQTLFGLWFDAFHFAAYAQLNAFGYFFENRNPCTLSIEDCPGAWCREYTFAADDYAPRWKIREVSGQDHGEWTFGQGYQDYTEPFGLSYLKVGMVFASDAEVLSVAFTFNIADNPTNGGGVNVYLRDWTSGAIIDSWIFTQLADGNYTRSHTQATPFAEDGFYIDIEAAQVTTITLIDATVNGQVNIGGLLGEVCE